MCGHHYPGNCRHFSSQRSVHSVVNLGGIVKTPRRSNSLSRSVFSTAGSFGSCSPKKGHWEIKGRFRKRVVLANVPSFRFSFRGNIRQNHPFGNHPFVNTKKGHWEIRGRFPKGWFWRTYPRSGFRSGGTSAKTTLLETTLLRTPESAPKNVPKKAPKNRMFSPNFSTEFFPEFSVCENVE